MGHTTRGPEPQRRTGAPGFFATTLPGLGRLLRQEIDAHPDLEPLEELGNAVESRIPAKVYDYLATGVPVITVCPPSAALLQLPEARRFHHVHHHDTTGLATLLRRARRDRGALRPGMRRDGPTREHGATTLHTLLLRRAQ
ncbi:MAG: hypothetical protein JO115_22090 [Pseudonocardiales bacterium]|nr:hypothetical protein [Pseudonocardiales bacterium]